MKTLFLILATLLISVIGKAQSVSCLYGAVNMSQRLAFAQYGVIQGFGPGCLVVQQDTSTLYMWDGSAYQLVSGAGIGITSLSAQVGQAQIFANDANVVMSHSNNTHTLGWSGTLSVARGGSGSALSPVLGGVVYSDATKLNVLAAGTSGLVLTSQGAAAPVWAAAGGGSGLTSLNAMTGSTQIFSNDTNITMTSSNNTHALGWASTLSLARGGTNAAVTAGAGRVVYSTATALATMSTTGTSGQVLLAGGTGTPTWGAAISNSAVASRIAQRDAQANLVSNNYIGCVLTPAGATQTVTSSSCNTIYVGFAGGNSTITLDGSAMVAGISFTIINGSSTGVQTTIKDQSAVTMAVLPYGAAATFTSISSSPADGSWVMNYFPWTAQGFFGHASLVDMRATVDVSGTLPSTDQTPFWVNGNCALASSVYTCTVYAGVFDATESIKCVATITGSTSGEITVTPASATSIVVRTFNSAGVASDRPFSLSCRN